MMQAPKPMIKSHLKKIATEFYLCFMPDIILNDLQISTSLLL